MIGLVFAAPNWSGSDTNILEILTPPQEDIKSVTWNGANYDLDTGKHNLLWTRQDGIDSPTLKININGIVSDSQTDGTFLDPGSWTGKTTKAVWIATSLKTILTSTIYGPDQYKALAAATASEDPYSTTTNQSSLVLNFEKNSGILAKVYGARNDLGGGLSMEYDRNAGSANDNSVVINMAGEGAKFYAKLVFGARSSQLDRIGSTNGVSPDQIVHAGFETNRNSVKITGLIPDGSAATLAAGDTLLGLIVTKGIFGAEGYQTNNNLVEIANATIVSGMPNARKLGIVGGRGLYYYRINSNNDGSYKEVVDGAAGFYESGQKASAIANNNIVTIKNSYLGYYISKDNNDWSGNWPNNNNYPTQEASNVGLSVYGGWSTGVAKDNIVAAEDSVINGNVIGGLEFQDQLKVTDRKFRNLHANLVSLKDVTLKSGSSIYGSATATGTLSTEVGYTSTNSLDETSVKAVNRRRGGAYIAGKVEADSAYVRYISFGQYLKINELDNKENYTVLQPYYPVSGQTVQEVAGLNANDPLEQATVRLVGDIEGSIHLGQQVAGSYLFARSGFHSSLASTDKTIQDPVTNGSHNFWVGTYANMSDGVSGDGQSFDTRVNLFTDGQVNHRYTAGELSLLTHDDGMWYAYSNEEDLGAELSNHRPALMHNFRYHYVGLVLYLGVDDGKEGQSVGISFDKIAAFRNEQGQDTNAFGNTFVGIIKDNSIYQKASVENGNNSVNAEEMTIDVPFTIYQTRDNQSVAVADATYAFYKYLHFDGKDGTLSDGTTGKVTEEGQAAGVGLKYWLKSVGIRSNEMLLLNGKQTNSVLEIEDFQSGDKSPKPLQELYTLSAELTGAGGVLIAPESTVVIGNPNTIYNISGSTKKSDGTYEVQYSDPKPNSYTGETILSQDAVLALGIDGALGSVDSHTSKLTLETGTKTALYLQGHTQTVGALDVQEGAALSFNEDAVISHEGKTEQYTANRGKTAGELTVQGKGSSTEEIATVRGLLKGTNLSKLTVINGTSSVYSKNDGFLGSYILQDASGSLYNTEAFVTATAVVDGNSSLYFRDLPKLTARTADAAYEPVKHFIGKVVNAGNVYLSSPIRKASGEVSESDVVLHDVQMGTYSGASGSIINYQGYVQGKDNSYVDVVTAQNVNNDSESFVSFNNETGSFGAFLKSRGETVGEGGTNGILIFEVKDPNDHVKLSFANGKETIGVVAKDNETHVKLYRLAEQGEDGNDWYLVNKADGDEIIPWTPLEPSTPVPEEPDNPDHPDEVLRPEGGAYIANSQSWAKMHMRLHDRFGQAYYIDPFDGKEKPAAAWIRQVGSHSHFRSGGGESKTHARTAVTQIGGDLIRNEFNEDLKYIGGVFVGGLYHRADTRAYNMAKSRSDGYSLGIYGTIYTGNSPDDGFYVDSWLLWGRYDNKLWGENTPTFKYKSHGWVWSVETGFTIPIGESGTKDFNKLIWTFQPEAQVVWDGVHAKNGYDSTETKYKQLGKDNVAIRLGARLHANYMNKGLGFIEGNWIHNTKKAGVQMGSSKTYMDGGRNLGEFRMGLEGHLSRNTLGWATVGVQAGKSGYHNETAQIGIKYMF